MAIATLGIFIRTAYRVAELNAGIRSDLAKNETAFMILEGSMVLISVISLTISHPGVGFQGRWAEANFKLKGDKGHTELESGETKPSTNVPLVSVGAK